MSDLLINCFKLSMPTSTCRREKLAVTWASLVSVFTPQGVIGTSLTNSRAPAGNLFLKAAEKSVAVSISMAIDRVCRKYFLKALSCSHTRRLVV